jgi:N-acetylglucosamine kinase-like BadF-type ATPase
MDLIVDSGATKADWIALDNNGKIAFSTQTLGLNPHVLTTSILRERIINNFEIFKNKKNFKNIFFYGAGCGVKTSIDRMYSVFDDIFENCKFIIKEDTYAAVYASAAIGEKSIVCILGTGSNCTFFDGKNAEQFIISLGYILMDEASGNFFGKQLLRGYYFHEMPLELSKQFENIYNLDPDHVKEFLYKKESPNAYLAKFAQFLIDNKNNDYMRTLIDNGLDRFIRHQILQFKEAKDIPVHFVGSISYFLKDEINAKLESYGLKLGNVVKRPIDKLVKFHSENKNF